MSQYFLTELLFQCGWYWGPMSGEAAEKVLANEPDGSFIVRDSSDHHYIFSLTFKLNGFVRHVRIEHDQGEIFSDGSLASFFIPFVIDLNHFHRKHKFTTLEFTMYFLAS